MRRRGTRAARADYLHEGGSRQESANTARTAQSFDDLMTIGLATVLTIGFLGETLARWPDPIRFDQFLIVYENPFSAVSILHP
jgi:hypothetical protein